MRAFASALATSLICATSAWAASPARVVSLNLCTDELLLALAAPRQISSLTHLSHDPRESAYWRLAQPYRANSGTILSVAQDRPDLIVTMGGGGRDNAGLAAALGARLLDLPFPSQLADVEVGIRLLAHALGRGLQGETLIGQIKAMAANRPQPKDAVFIGSAGRSMAAHGAGAEWMRLSGLRQIPLRDDRFDREQLLRLPPVTLLVSNYRIDQYSRTGSLPVRRNRDRQIETDGRRWTCMGPSLLPEIAKIRRMVTP